MSRIASPGFPEAVADEVFGVGFWGWVALDSRILDRAAQDLRAAAAEGRLGTMDWLAAHAPDRQNPWARWPWARSVVVVLDPYPLPPPPLRGKRPVVAAYARGDDYHLVLSVRLRAFVSRLRAENPAMKAHPMVDAHPLPEVELAVHAGLGWRGRNTLLLTRSGSAFRLGLVLLPLEAPSVVAFHDHCGGCRACLDACPTGAILPDARLDASRCLSHWNIEGRGLPDGPAAREARDELFGCDICQTACPWNHRAMHEARVVEPPEGWPVSWEDWERTLREGGGFWNRFRRTPLRRAGRRGLERVLQLLLANRHTTETDAVD